MVLELHQVVDSPLHLEGAAPLDAHQRLHKEKINNNEELLHMKKLLAKYYNYGTIIT